MLKLKPTKYLLKYTILYLHFVGHRLPPYLICTHQLIGWCIVLMGFLYHIFPLMQFP